MIAEASLLPPAFNCLLVDDSSRLSRSIGDFDRISKRLKFAGVKIVYVSQGFDSESESAGNERYRGVLILGKTFKLRSLETGKRIYKRKPEAPQARQK